jgi:hypothetical protein
MLQAITNRHKQGKERKKKKGIRNIHFICCESDAGNKNYGSKVPK